MFVGQKLGQTIPAQISVYTDIASGITMRQNLDNRTSTRYRNLDPDTIGVATNTIVDYVLNFYVLRSNISANLNTDVSEIRQRKIKSSIKNIIDVTLDEVRTRQIDSSIGVTSDLLSSILRTRELQSDIDARANLGFEAIRFRYNSVDIDAKAKIAISEQRVRQTRPVVEIAIDVNSSEERERHISSAINAATDVIATILRTIGMSADITGAADLDVDEIRTRLARADIDVETSMSSLIVIVALLFRFSGDLEPGDTLVIDTDELTIEKSDGTNMRKYFDGEWYEVDPNAVASLSYSDAEGSRDIEFVIEKEDRSI